MNTSIWPTLAAVGASCLIALLIVIDLLGAIAQGGGL